MKILEKVWNQISGEIDGFFFNRQLQENLKMGFIIRQRLVDYLNKKGLSHVIGVFHDSWDGEPEVKVKVLLLHKHNFKENMQLLEELVEVGYEGLTNDEMHNIWIHVEPPKTDFGEE